MISMNKLKLLKKKTNQKHSDFETLETLFDLIESTFGPLGHDTIESKIDEDEPKHYNLNFFESIQDSLVKMDGVAIIRLIERILKYEKTKSIHNQFWFLSDSILQTLTETYLCDNGIKNFYFSIFCVLYFGKTAELGTLKQSQKIYQKLPIVVPEYLYHMIHKETLKTLQKEMPKGAVEEKFPFPNYYWDEDFYEINPLSELKPLLTAHLQYPEEKVRMKHDIASSLFTYRGAIYSYMDKLLEYYSLKIPKRIFEIRTVFAIYKSLIETSEGKFHFKLPYYKLRELFDSFPFKIKESRLVYFGKHHSIRILDNEETREQEFKNLFGDFLPFERSIGYFDMGDFHSGFMFLFMSLIRYQYNLEEDSIMRRAKGIEFELYIFKCLQSLGYEPYKLILHSAHGKESDLYQDLKLQIEDFPKDRIIECEVPLRGKFMEYDLVYRAGDELHILELKGTSERIGMNHKIRWIEHRIEWMRSTEVKRQYLADRINRFEKVHPIFQSYPKVIAEIVISEGTSEIDQNIFTCPDYIEKMMDNSTEQKL